ncbi:MULTISPECIES: aminotransferase class I/II-fold pyridoxal phosphate-dependent enzyme [Photorhabdus]|uniref:Aminotransferase n=1 Tax=Photorhabdus thracensis TaxID=230089 RepID=A0A0F7LRC4_9GAMM|nr:aminotransferase class I/II-fold pyridoxal phosphate-dependent enzyme [Photorhabdus thracensis]AKH64312.1 aminotransferase [Photorhabdus thracensis]MCC8422572.1 aminotransferase class I/II-fold pyridoxal phosphate-dependent enzyme [Photorhabdus thracensis]
MDVKQKQDWMTIRRSRTTGALAQAIDEGLTNFTVVERQGKQITTEEGKVFTEFVSCSYLGLEHHPALIEAANQAMARTGIHLSSSRGAMRPQYLRQLEELLEEIYQGGSVAVFTSTSNVHLGVLPLLGSGSLPNYPLTRPVHWLVDKTAHASMQILRGILEQFGPVSRVDSTDGQSVQQALQNCGDNQRTPILLIDGIGSMNGLIPVAELTRKLAAAGGYVYVDDAHGISIVGRHGAGYAFAALDHILPPNLILAGSLSKAFGGAGGFVVVAGTDDVEVISTLANPLVFGHSIMVPMLAANVAAAKLHLSLEIEIRQEQLWKNVNLFDSLTGNSLMNASVQSPVRGALFENEAEGLEAARLLRDNGILLFPVFYPLVQDGNAMLRFAFSSEHKESEIRHLANTLLKIREKGLNWSEPQAIAPQV